ncbi:MAG: hypothetical protein UH103_07515 [Paludibacteraceae bacterium]|jgi:hypothetical protein|nr:hypothetical protein [Paludibacteraceae bacterium]
MRKFFYILLSFVAATTVIAQNNDTTIIDRNINIEKEYIPEIETSEPQKFNIKIQEPNVPDAQFNYSTYASGVQPKSNFYPLDPQEQAKPKRTSLKQGYTELGFGYPINWSAELFYPLYNKKNTNFDLHLDHTGLYTQTIKLIETDFDLILHHTIGRNHQLNFAVNYNNDFYNYYGNGILFDSIPQIVHRAGIVFGMQSTNRINGWGYQANLHYKNMFLHYTPTHEHRIVLDGEISKILGKKPLNIGIFADINILNSQFSILNSKLSTTAVIGLLPSYDIVLDNLRFHLGAKAYFSINKGRVFNAMPDVTINYNEGKIFSIYAGITGDYQINTLSTTLEQCRYFDPRSTGIALNTYTPADFFAGFRLKPYLEGLLVDAHINYKFIYDDYFIHNVIDSTSNNYINIFTADFSNTQILSTGARINYNYQNKYVAHAGFKYNHYTIADSSLIMVNRPTWEIEIGTEMTPIKGLSINADFYTGLGYKAILPNENINLPNHFDLNIGAAYTFHEQCAVFARFNNIINSKYQYYYGYENIGFNCLFGIKITF